MIWGGNLNRVLRYTIMVKNVRVALSKKKPNNIHTSSGGWLRGWTPSFSSPTAKTLRTTRLWRRKCLHPQILPSHGLSAKGGGKFPSIRTHPIQSDYPRQDQQHPHLCLHFPRNNLHSKFGKLNYLRTNWTSTEGTAADEGKVTRHHAPKMTM